MAGQEVKKGWEREHTGFAGVKTIHFVPGRGYTRHRRYDRTPTLDRILRDEEVLSAARELEGRIATTDAFWRDLLEAGATGPREFQITPKVTEAQQANEFAAVIRIVQQLLARVDRLYRATADGA